MTKKTKTPSVAKLKKEADACFSKYIRFRDGKLTENGWWAQCITCDRWYPYKQIQAGHFQSRRFNNTRFDEQNVNAQCSGCNVFNHGEQYKYGKAVDLKYGDGTAEALHHKAQELHKFTMLELQEIIDDAKEQIKSYESQGVVYE